MLCPMASLSKVHLKFEGTKKRKAQSERVEGAKDPAAKARERRRARPSLKQQQAQRS